MVKGLFHRPSEAERAAEDLYRAVVAQARIPGFYRDLGVPDSIDGRFELIVLHAALLIARLRRDGPDGEELAQLVFDGLFRDMDINLREMGAGDIGVARRIKAMAQAFYGRAAAYGAETTQPAGDLEDALRRNLFGTVEPEAWQLSAIAGYVEAARTGLEQISQGALSRGSVAFPPPPGPD